MRYLGDRLFEKLSAEGSPIFRAQPNDIPGEEFYASGGPEEGYGYLRQNPYASLVGGRDIYDGMEDEREEWHAQERGLPATPGVRLKRALGLGALGGAASLAGGLNRRGVGLGVGAGALIGGLIPKQRETRYRGEDQDEAERIYQEIYARRAAEEGQ